MKLIKQVLIFIFRFFTGYYLIIFLGKTLLRFVYPITPKRIYLKETLHLSLENMTRYRYITQACFGIFSVAVIAYILLFNFAPLGMSFNYSLDQQDKNPLTLGPKDRVVKTENNNVPTYKLIHDLIYFTTNMPYHFDTATVTITYKNPYPDQELALGFQDKADEWHYNTKWFDVPFLNSLPWGEIGNGPTIFQREKQYTSVSDFLNHPPKDGVIGTYDFDTSTLPAFRTVIPNYTPQKGMTVIDTPFRGSQVMYAYVKNEPFIMKVTKQDLNWYEGDDNVSIRIYKEGDLVYHADIPDDGINDASKKQTPPQEIEIRNPGPGLPEPGVYKIVIDAPGDVVIKKIETNLHKIVFQGPLFPVSNSSIYPQITASTSATTLYTNALSLTAQTYHPQSLQTIWVNNTPIKLRTLNNDQIIEPQQNLSSLTIPKNDVIINGLFGYFSLNRNDFFTPTPYFTMPITSADDLNLVDYIITDYTLPGYENGWYVATRTFDLSSAVVNNGKLSWLIKAPGLKKDNRSILIKNVEVTLSKKPLIKFKS